MYGLKSTTGLLGTQGGQGTKQKIARGILLQESFCAFYETETAGKAESVFMEWLKQCKGSRNKIKVIKHSHYNFRDMDYFFSKSRCQQDFEKEKRLLIMGTTKEPNKAKELKR